MKKSILFLAMLCTLLCVFTACHEHIFGDWKTVKEPTCTEEGTKERTCECGEKESEAIPAVGHTEGEWVTDKEATCTEKGEKHLECAVCGETIRSEEIPAAGEHQYLASITKAATCTVNGTRAYTCKKCGDKYTETIPAAHKWKDATCTEPKTCSACKKTEGKALGHTTDYGICSRCKIKFVYGWTVKDFDELSELLNNTSDIIKSKMPASGSGYAYYLKSYMAFFDAKVEAEKVREMLNSRPALDYLVQADTGEKVASVQEWADMLFEDIESGLNNSKEYAQSDPYGFGVLAVKADVAAVTGCISGMLIEIITYKAIANKF